MNDCEFHNGNKALVYENDKNCMFIDSAGLMDIYIDNKHFRFACEFCPKCGERLRCDFLE